MGSGSSSSADYFKNFKFEGREWKLYKYGLLQFIDREGEEHLKEEIIRKSTVTRIELWKVPLFEWLPSDFGLFYHAYLVLKTKRLLQREETLYWSLEKNRERVHLQLSYGIGDVIGNFALSSRLFGNYWKPQKIDEYTPDSIMTVEEIFSVYLKSENSKFYDVLLSNCKHFAQDIFNAMCKDFKRDSFEACSFKSYIFNNVKELLLNPTSTCLNLYIRAVCIRYCYLNSLYLTIYLSFFITLTD